MSIKKKQPVIEMLQGVLKQECADYHGVFSAVMCLQTFTINPYWPPFGMQTLRDMFFYVLFKRLALYKLLVHTVF